MGIGISNQFNTIDLSAESPGSNVLVKAADDPEKGGEWAVFDLAYDDEFAVALAVEWPCVLLPRICPFSLDPDA